MTKPVVIFGATGHLGRALMEVLGPRGIGFHRNEAPFDHTEKILHTLDQTNPSAVINAAAYTQVDRAEQEEALAYQINSQIPEQIAMWCMKHHIPFIHYSTDYVFSGESMRPWVELDPTSPLNAYGRTKLAGEQAIAKVGGKWLIFRTSWIYDHQGKNFLNTMLQLGRSKEVLRIVSDQIGAPTYALALARATIKTLEQTMQMLKFPSGIYHLCGAGETSWHGFAQTIFTYAKKQGLDLKVKIVEPIPSSEYPMPAKRPLNSRLNMEKIQCVFNIKMPHWNESLVECFNFLRKTL